MNHNTQLNRLIKLQTGYLNFMPFCPIENLPELLIETHKITTRVNKINTLTIAEANKEVHFFYQTEQSKLNFLDS